MRVRRSKTVAILVQLGRVRATHVGRIAVVYMYMELVRINHARTFSRVAGYTVPRLMTLFRATLIIFLGTAYKWELGGPTDRPVCTYITHVRTKCHPPENPSTLQLPQTALSGGLNLWNAMVFLPYKKKEGLNLYDTSSSCSRANKRRLGLPSLPRHGLRRSLSPTSTVFV